MAARRSSPWLVGKKSSASARSSSTRGFGALGATVRRTMLSTRQLQRAVPRGYPAAAVDAARQALGDANKVRDARAPFRALAAALPRGFHPPSLRAVRVSQASAHKACPTVPAHRTQVFTRDNSSLPVTFEHRGTGGRSSIRCVTRPRAPANPSRVTRESPVCAPAFATNARQRAIFLPACDRSLTPPSRAERTQRDHEHGFRRDRFPGQVRGEPHRQERVSDDPAGAV